jgi:hypothetical protein
LNNLAFVRAYAKFSRNTFGGQKSLMPVLSGFKADRWGFRPLVMSVTVMRSEHENFNSVQVNSLAVAVVELLPLAGILFWLQQVRLKKRVA